MDNTNAWVKCPDCKGKGYFFFPKYSPIPAPCETCKGNGSMTKEAYDDLLKEGEEDL